MGYRSKVIVGVAMDNIHSNEFDELLRKNGYKPEKSSDFLKIDDVDGYKTYTFDFIKWNDHEDWCKEIMNWLDDKQDENEHSCWCVGLGEMGELHSEVGDYWDFVDVVRDIELTHQKHKNL